MDVGVHVTCDRNVDSYGSTDDFPQAENSSVSQSAPGPTTTTGIPAALRRAPATGRALLASPKPQQALRSGEPQTPASPTSVDRLGSPTNGVRLAQAYSSFRDSLVNTLQTACPEKVHALPHILSPQHSSASPFAGTQPSSLPPPSLLSSAPSAVSLKQAPHSPSKAGGVEVVPGVSDVLWNTVAAEGVRVQARTSETFALSDRMKSLRMVSAELGADLEQAVSEKAALQHALANAAISGSDLERQVHRLALQVIEARQALTARRRGETEAFKVVNNGKEQLLSDLSRTNQHISLMTLQTKFKVEQVQYERELTTLASQLGGCILEERHSRQLVATAEQQLQSCQKQIAELDRSVVALRGTSPVSHRQDGGGELGDASGPFGVFMRGNSLLPNLDKLELNIDAVAALAPEMRQNYLRHLSRYYEQLTGLTSHLKATMMATNGFCRSLEYYDTQEWINNRTAELFEALGARVLLLNYGLLTCITVSPDGTKLQQRFELAPGLTSDAIKSGDVISVHNAIEPDHALALPDVDHFTVYPLRNLMVGCIHNDGKLIAVLQVFNKATKFCDKDVLAFRYILSQASVALGNALAFQEQQQLATARRAVQEFLPQLFVTTDEGKIAELLCGFGKRLLNAHRCQVVLLRQPRRGALAQEGSDGGAAAAAAVEAEDAIQRDASQLTDAPSTPLPDASFDVTGNNPSNGSGDDEQALLLAAAAAAAGLDPCISGTSSNGGDASRTAGVPPAAAAATGVASPPVTPGTDASSAAALSPSSPKVHSLRSAPHVLFRTSTANRRSNKANSPAVASPRSKQGGPDSKARRSSAAASAKHPIIIQSNTLLDSVIDSNMPLVLADANDDELFEADDPSVVPNSFRTLRLLVHPITDSAGIVLGALQLSRGWPDSLEPDHLWADASLDVFTSFDVQVVGLLCAQAAVALRMARLYVRTEGLPQVLHDVREPLNLEQAAERILEAAQAICPCASARLLMPSEFGDQYYQVRTASTDMDGDASTSAVPLAPPHRQYFPMRGVMAVPFTTGQVTSVYDRSVGSAARHSPSFSSGGGQDRRDGAASLATATSYSSPCDSADLADLIMPAVAMKEVYIGTQTTPARPEMYGATSSPSSPTRTSTLDAARGVHRLGGGPSSGSLHHSPSAALVRSGSMGHALLDNSNSRRLPDSARAAGDSVAASGAGAAAAATAAAAGPSEASSPLLRRSAPAPFLRSTMTIATKAMSTAAASELATPAHVGGRFQSLLLVPVFDPASQVAKAALHSRSADGASATSASGRPVIAVVQLVDKRGPTSEFDQHDTFVLKGLTNQGGTLLQAALLHARVQAAQRDTRALATFLAEMREFSHLSQSTPAFSAWLVRWLPSLVPCQAAEVLWWEPDAEQLVRYGRWGSAPLEPEARFSSVMIRSAVNALPTGSRARGAYGALRDQCTWHGIVAAASSAVSDHPLSNFNNADGGDGCGGGGGGDGCSGSDDGSEQLTVGVFVPVTAPSGTRLGVVMLSQATPPGAPDPPAAVSVVRFTNPQIALLELIATHVALFVEASDGLSHSSH